ncbi:MAG: glycolate oxidase subunit GlcE [Burkholderiales bacterium]|nr:glycolate oxidase subunit GlcE [Burkholderiales bacterium]
MMIDQFQNQIRDAYTKGRQLRIVGAASRQAWLPPTEGEALAVGAYTGIIDYQPHELYLSARAGTPLAAIRTLLAEHRQMLACEPPNIDQAGTLGGALATGWSGPRRPWSGAVRDHVLGLTMLDGRGELLRFGGRVMKNVAGFDVSRLMVGSLGSLGAILDVHIKVMPLPETELVLVQSCGQSEAILLANRYSAAALPLSGAAWEAGLLRLRLSGNASAVAAARQQIGGDEDLDGLAWFDALRDFRLAFFDQPAPGMALWRLSLPPTASSTLVGYPQVVDWGGGQRWLHAHVEATSIIQSAARSAGGYASCRRVNAPWPEPTFLLPTIATLQRRLKSAFDPGALFAHTPPPIA